MIDCLVLTLYAVIIGSNCRDPLGGVNLNKSVLDSGMCRLQLNSKESAPAGPLKAIDLCSTPLGDDDDKNLQAALLASMHEPSDYNEPGMPSFRALALVCMLDSSRELLGCCDQT